MPEQPGGHEEPEGSGTSGSQTSGAVTKPSPQKGMRIVHSPASPGGAQKAGAGGTKSQVSPASVTPSPHTRVQSAGHVGSSAKSQVSPKAESTRPLPHVYVTQDTTV